ncbi:hypothetical protein RCIA102 [Methanocella arvoryzae MRE50]|uniref:Uncharacterized protein n=1 Tax=Methanocella arvoryzae (strain DSM 22066 / NBRC 105507 / MRE50) TaxID=351160 RepID=Q0W4N1_METAR|nr:hypothetical protein RCIA102 [Methanocella arvoryzae MRE50]
MLSVIDIIVLIPSVISSSNLWIQQRNLWNQTESVASVRTGTAQRSCTFMNTKTTICQYTCNDGQHSAAFDNVHGLGDRKASHRPPAFLPAFYARQYYIY